MSHESPRNNLSQDPVVTSVPRAFDSMSKLVAGAIAVAAVGLGVLAAIFNPFLPAVAAREGSQIDTLFSVTLGIATTVFVVVQGFLLYSIVRFGRAPGDESDGPPIRGNVRLELLWTTIPAAVVLFLGIYSYQVLAAIEQPSQGERVIEVTALQYVWQFYYPEHDLVSNELHIPLDQTVWLKMRSKDLIHSFWVPAFRIKKDVMPDRVTEVRITGTELGAFPIVCAELCGAGHAGMTSQVVVQSDADYKSWLAGRSAPAGAATPSDVSEPIATGRKLFSQYTCNACHSLADANATGQVGPPLDGYGARAGSMTPGERASEDAAREAIREAILSPNKSIAKGYSGGVMPQDYALRMSETEIEALVNYLQQH